MRFALDFDGTYSDDKGLWDKFIGNCLQRDHEVVVVTFRPDDCPIEFNTFGIPVYYTNGIPKRKFMDNLGVKINVWIDDMPELIVFESEWTPEERARWRAANGFPVPE